MQLQVPPKEALKKIELVLIEGDEIHLKIGRGEVLFYENKKYKKKDSQEIPNIEAYRQTIDFVEGLFLEWFEKVITTLEEVFDSSIYQRAFKMSKVKKKTTHEDEKDVLIEKYGEIYQEFEKKLEYLQSLFFKIEENIKSPLFYIKERSTLCYYDFVCELKAESNEALLCEYMFQFSIGSKKELAEIYKFMIGEEFLKGDEKVVKHALEGVNSKTRKHFGFSIFSKEKSVVYIAIKH